MELDHVFLRAACAAPEAEQLRRFGLVEGSGNSHPGQGTANRRFFFHNAFLELLWIADEQEIHSAMTRPTRLAAHLASDAASPFGICFRPSAAASSEGPAFPAWPYRPTYLPPGMRIDLARDTPLAEPMCFFLAQATAPAAAPAERRQPLEHPAGLRVITSLRLTVPGGQARSAAALAAMATGQLRMEEGAEHLLEIGFDGEAAGKRHDFRPGLPLVFRY